MQFSKDLALELLGLCEQAYLLANTGHCVLPDGFSEPIPIRMPVGDRPFFLRDDPLDIWGYAVSSLGNLYLVFRGTQITGSIDFAQEWVEDAISLPLVKLGSGHVHLGFYEAWAALRQSVQKALDEVSGPIVDIEAVVAAHTGQLTITGHSLGAAIATLCWVELGGELLTLASPRVGDPDFAKSLWDGQTVRVINEPDIVPNVPTDPPFRHGGQEVVVRGPGSMLELKVAHSLASYRAGLLLL